jgi:uncharacterized protein (DUF302 family)
VITAEAPVDVATAVERIQAALAERGVTLFATIDHAAGGRAVGLPLDDEVVLIFGNPQAGTPLMQQDARVGIELPMRMLVWSDSGTTRVGYLDPRRLADQFDLAGHEPRLEKLAGLLAALQAVATAA